MGADAVLDFAGLESAVSTAADSVSQEVDSEATLDDIAVDGGENTTNEDGSSVGDGDKSEYEIKIDSKKEDGTPKTEEEIAEEKKTKQAELDAKKLPGGKNTPDHIRKTLKAIRDANPTENGNAVKELHGAYERWAAAKQVFPKGVQEMKDAKALIDLVGGQDGYNNFVSQKQAIEEVDQKLYAGDPELAADIYSDLKAENKLEAFPKLASAFLDKLKSENRDEYYKIHGPHFVSALEETNIPGVFKGIENALTSLKDDSKPEEIKAAVQKALSIAQRATKWAVDMKEQHGKKEEDTALSPERKKLEDERKRFMDEQTKWKTNQTKAFQTDVAKEAETTDLRTLGKELGSFLKMPFFKGFPKETQRNLAAGVIGRLRQALTSDGVYQAQMKALWGAKEPSKSKLLEYHNTKVASIARDIVTKEVQDRYPTYRKGGAAAGRVAAAQVKKEQQSKQDAAAVASGKPVYVATKPKELVRNQSLTVGGKEYKAGDLVTLEIMGKGFIKNSNGTYRYITWRKGA